MCKAHNKAAKISQGYILAVSVAFLAGLPLTT